MKFIVKCKGGHLDGHYYLEAGQGVTPHRSKAFVYDSEVIKMDPRICWEDYNKWIHPDRQVIIPVGDL